MLMNVSSNVRVPTGYGTGKYTPFFYQFLDSADKTESMEFDTVQEAIMCTKSICNTMNTKRIWNVRQKRRMNVVYWEKVTE